MAEWEKYDGTDEQIAEIENAEDGYLLKFANGHITSVQHGENYDYEYVTHYLICDPHPLADMIIRQAQTGQPVWVRDYAGVYVTNKPNWNMPDSEYSFTPFDE